MLAITFATPDEIPLLRELARHIWNACYPGIITQEQIDYMLARMYDASCIAAEMKNGVDWFLARHDSVPAGFIACEFSPSARSLKLHKLYLLPALHGRGLGRLLLEHVVAHAASLHAREIVLQVNRRNSRAIRAYERSGFVVRENAVTDIGGGFVMDDFIMVLPLATRTDRS